MQNSSAHFFLTHRFKLFALLLITIALEGCALIPEQEFADYMATFAQVRKVNELVLMDYAAAKKEKQAIDQEQQGEPYIRQPSFKINQLVLPEDSIEDIRVRFKTWEAIDTYNQALADLIAGKLSESRSKTDKMWQTLIGLSVKAAAHLLPQVSPAFSALSGIMSQVEIIYAQQKILSSLIEASPQISKLIGNMKKDIVSFYRVRYGLNNYYYQQGNARIGRKVGEFIRLAQTLSPESRKKQVLPMVKTLNDNLSTIARTAVNPAFGFKKVELKGKFGKSNSSETLSKLNNQKDEIIDLIRQAQRQDRTLEAYRQALTVYAYLLNELDFRLKLMLEIAKEQKPIEDLAVTDLKETVLKMQQAYLYYENNK